MPIVTDPISKRTFRTEGADFGYKWEAQYEGGWFLFYYFPVDRMFIESFGEMIDDTPPTTQHFSGTATLKYGEIPDGIAYSWPYNIKTTNPYYWLYTSPPEPNWMRDVGL